jgi:hypothetical protein
MATLEEVLAEAQRNKRVCPQPDKWHELYELLPNRRRVGGGWEPPLPLILAAWSSTPALPKFLRLREHIAWASEHGVLDAVHCFLMSLDETDWYHVGE